MNEGKTQVPKGVYNCVLVDAVRSGKSNHTMHYILSLRVRPTDCGVENPCEYYAELPILFKMGAEFNFYNREKQVNERRKCTSEDTKAAVEYARKCIPAWAEYCDGLGAGATFTDGLAWFDDIPADTIVRALCKDPRYYNEKPYYDAVIYEQRGSGKKAVEDADDFNAEFGAIIKAAGIKFGGGQVAAKASVKKPTQPTPPAPPAPTKKADAKVYTSEDAWNAYEGGERIKTDPNGAKYWGEVEKIVGKPVSNYGEWTSEDWRKCVEAFDGMPF